MDQFDNLYEFRLNMDNISVKVTSNEFTNDTDA